MREALRESERLRIAVEEALEHELSSGDEHVDVHPVGENFFPIPSIVNCEWGY